MSDEGRIFFATSLNFQGLLSSKGLHGYPDCFVKNAVQDVERFASYEHVVPFSQVVNAFAEDVVLGNNLNDIEPVLKSLHPMHGRRALQYGFLDRRVVGGSEASANSSRSAGT